MVVSDNGTELTSTAILRWQQENGVAWHYIAPGKPTLHRLQQSRERDLAATTPIYAPLRLDP